MKDLFQEQFSCGVPLDTSNPFHQSEFFLHVVGSLTVMIPTYWILGMLFAVTDLTGKPSFIFKYKIREAESNTYPRVTFRRLVIVARQVLCNQIVVATPVIAASYYVKQWRGYSRSYERPSVFQLIGALPIYILVEETCFYYSHRFLHHPRIYKRFHKRHHEWVSPIGLSAIYCHPVEHVLSNVLPTILGPVITGSHVAWMWLWLLLTTSYGVIVHSGYHLPLTPSPEAHDFHHVKFDENYGVIGLLDWLHGTDKDFRQSKYFQRHKVILHL